MASTTLTIPVSFDDIFRELQNDMNIEDENVDFDTIDVTVQDEEQAPFDELDKDDDEDPNVEERILSQKLSQLSTSLEGDISTTNKRQRRQQHELKTTSVAKKMKQDDDTVDTDVIPDYLSVTNKSFEQTILPILRNTGNPINIDQLRQQAILLHRRSMLNLHKSLWNTYLRSGTGQLKGHNQDNNPHIWPTHVESMMIAKGLPIMTKENTINHDVYIDFVNKHIRQLNDKAEQYQAQYETRKKSLEGYTNSIEAIIEQLIQQEGIAHIRLQFDSKIALTYGA